MTSQGYDFYPLRIIDKISALCTATLSMYLNIATFKSLSGLLTDPGSFQDCLGFPKDIGVPVQIS